MKQTKNTLFEATILLLALSYLVTGCATSKNQTMQAQAPAELVRCTVILQDEKKQDTKEIRAKKKVSETFEKDFLLMSCLDYANHSVTEHAGYTVREIKTEYY